MKVDAEKIEHDESLRIHYNGIVTHQVMPVLIGVPGGHKHARILGKQRPTACKRHQRVTLPVSTRVLNISIEIKQGFASNPRSSWQQIRSR